MHTDIKGYELIKVSKGVPQGGVLGPIFYLIYVVNIAQKVPKSVNVSQFADDISVYASIAPLEYCRDIIEKSTIIIQNNLSKLGIELAPEKTRLIHFNNKITG